MLTRIDDIGVFSYGLDFGIIRTSARIWQMDKPTWKTADIMEALMDNASSKTPMKPQTPQVCGFVFIHFIIINMVKK
ncbi:hypothetical protein A9Z63_03975 [Moraxella lacunata]|uniref:Uncharacterized protein n=1 Tax=Moraxella lacunata TaxID=477 RepID=A0A1B8Q2J8_MORLA|nr:hypothetical protein A9309_06290 [Moraxella lacunata]OBX64183.1 hypothetical protein A9Z63_03975 [Moraxella lacunata]